MVQDRFLQPVENAGAGAQIRELRTDVASLGVELSRRIGRVMGVVEIDRGKRAYCSGQPPEVFRVHEILFC
nr:hypothetical protein [Mycobacterium sp.]